LLRERFAAIATDAIRADCLEKSGYSVQVLEFIDMSHTPKNILLRAVKRKIPDFQAEAAAQKRIKSLSLALDSKPEILNLLEGTNL